LIAFFQVEETIPNEGSCIFAGDGTDDLNLIITRMKRNNTLPFPPRYTIVVRDDTLPCTVGDIEMIRLEFIRIYGNVPNPSVFGPLQS
jgi:hypothetical protein